MKNRFYGDVNDYIKYGILDILSKKYNAIGINWYLTDDRHGNQKHGNIMHHINNEKEWQDYNPRIFSTLKNRVQANQRNIRYCKKDKIFKFKHEFREQLPDNAAPSNYLKLRNQWHARAISNLRECDLIFFDPDVGVIDRLSKDVVKNSEYCLIKEIEDYDWCDWLIVQFPRRMKRYPALKINPIVRSAEQKKKKVIVFIYGGMALIYISNAIQAQSMCSVFKEWEQKLIQKYLFLRSCSFANRRVSETMSQIKKSLHDRV